MHGTTMIFLVVMPMSAAFFNLLIPLQIGARDVAFPRLNAFSYWVYLLGGSFITLPILFNIGAERRMVRLRAAHHDAVFAGTEHRLLGARPPDPRHLARSRPAFNFITTIINMRAPGMNLMRMPMFTWMAFVVQFLIILAFPVITIALVFLLFDRFFGTNFYEIAAGADPLLWQHLFWVFGHPEVYILSCRRSDWCRKSCRRSRRKPLFGYPVMVYSGILIGFLGFGVWAHHMFAVGMGPIADTVFGVTTMLIAIPDGREDLQLDLHDVGRLDPLHDGDAMFAIGLVAHVHDRRHLGDHALVAAGRPAADRHVLHRRALPLRAVRRVAHGAVRRHLLLLPEAHRPPTERDARHVALLAQPSSARTWRSSRCTSRACSGCRAASTPTTPDQGWDTFNMHVVDRRASPSASRR